jgi:hypothetical protein
MAKRPTVGDIIEVPTSDGFAYALYTHDHDLKPHFGALIRVLDGRFAERPASFAVLLEKPPRFSVFFPLAAALSRGLVQVVAHAPVPAGLQPFPIFKTHADADATSESKDWWLWDGRREWHVERLSADEKCFPYLQLVNDTTLIDLIESGYRDGEPRFVRQRTDASLN